MQGLAFGTGDTPQPIQNAENLSIDDLFKPNAQRYAPQTETEEGKQEGKDDREYHSEDFVISKIDASGNLKRITPPKK